MKTSPALRWFWRIYLPLAALLVVTMLAAPLGQFVEENVWPVRTDQRIEQIVRTSDRLCWSWCERESTQPRLRQHGRVPEHDVGPHGALGVRT